MQRGCGFALKSLCAHRFFHQTASLFGRQTTPKQPGATPEKIRKDFTRMREFTREGMQAFTDLKLVKNNPKKLETFLKQTTSRMLKKDLVCVFELLRKHKEDDLAVKIFDVIRKETWYEPNMIMYWEMSIIYITARRLDDVWKLMDEMEANAVLPNRHFFTHAIKCCLEMGDFQRLRKFYTRMMSTSQLHLDRVFFASLLSKLQGASQIEVAEQVKKDLAKFIQRQKEGGQSFETPQEHDDFWRRD